MTAIEAKHEVVSSTRWMEARQALLAKEKEFTRQRDQLSRQRRELPWESVGKNYVFNGSSGEQTLGDLFEGRNQLIVYHFMLGPDWKEGCPGCSFVSDHFDGSLAHLANRGVTFVAISRAPLPQIEVFQKRMGWQFKWVSSSGSDFNFDYGVSFPEADPKADEAPGLSVFYKEASGAIFHTYSTYARGLEPLIGAYTLLDFTPKGRNEDGIIPPMSWVRHRDRYENVPAVKPASCCHAETVNGCSRPPELPPFPNAPRAWPYTSQLPRELGFLRQPLPGFATSCRFPASRSFFLPRLPFLGGA